ncbi:MAG: PepSY-associated TM helix domain-containing protein [Aliiglaciecola sp.]|uniref:PepSY-associated TM helix domain-containing protein n=1 Tax=Aliiglaciecola sp. TaxID=1872441 RepID=UPI0032979A48
MFLKSFRRWIFWVHLIVGLIAGIFVLCMSFSGVLLTYERQLKELSEMQYSVQPNTTIKRLDTDQVVAILQKLKPDEPHIYVRWVNREGAAIPAWAGKYSYLLHPYTGEVVRSGEGAVAEFFHIVTDFHRYLSLVGEAKVIGKNITAYANLVFIFLLISGLYLWFPKRFSRKLFKLHLFLPKHFQNSHHRNRQWHLVFGIWCLPVLFVISMTATIFHFSWANTALYGAFGESVPQPEQHIEVTSLTADVVPYEELFNKAKQHAANNGYQYWYSMWMEIGETKNEARFYIDKSIGNRQELAYSLYFDTRNGDVSKVLRKDDWSLGGQAWGTARFLHTGEYFGFIGQTIAGIASLLACILVYTGIMLGWKRLVVK